MGLSREFLKGLELDKSTIDAIMSEYGSGVTELKEQLEEFKAKNASLTTSVSEYEKLKADYEQLSTTYKELEAEKTKIATEKDELSTKNAEQIVKLKRDYAISSAIAKSNPRDEKAYRAHLDESKITLNENGELEGFDDQDKDIKENYSYLFDEGIGTGSAHGGIHGSGATLSLADAINETL